MRWPNRYDYHRWHTWFALFPISIQKQIVWLEWYQWRRTGKPATFGYYFERRTIDGSLCEEIYVGDTD